MSMINTLLFSAFLIGFTSMVAQVIFMRELIIIFYGNELSLGIILAAWLFWVGSGSWIFGRIVRIVRHQIALFVSCQFLTFAIFPLAIFAVRNLRNILNTMPGEIMGFMPMLASSFSVLAPLCILLGFSFALACHVLANIWEKSARSIGQIYIIEAIGASVGGLLTSFVLIPYFSVYQSIFIIGVLNLTAALMLQIAVKRGHQVSDLRAVTAILITSFFIGVVVLAFPLGLVSKLENFSAKLQWRGLNLVDSKNSIYGNIAVTKLGEEQYSFFENGLLMFTTSDKLSPEESIHLAMLEHPAPENVLLIGGGVGGALEQILKHPVKWVDYVELDPKIIEVASKFMSKDDIAYLHDERVAVKHIDARFFIKRLSSGKKNAKRRRYDVILVNLPDPSTALLNRFYSFEFFQEAKRILAPGGILSLSITSSENYLSHEQQAFLRSLYATLNQIFDEIIVIPGANNYLLAQSLPSGGQNKTQSLTYDVDVLVERMRERNLNNLYVHEYYLPIRLSPDRVEYIEDIVSNTPKNTRINSDFKPIGYFYNMILWSSQFRQRSFDVGFFKHFAKLNFWHVLGFIILFISIFLAIQIRRIRNSTKAEHANRMAVILSVGTTGFSEILFQVVVILAFQVLYGYVYYKLTLILASFMIGLVLGSWIVNRMLNRLKNDLFTYIMTQVSICIYPLILLPVFMGLASFGERIPPAIHIDTIFAFLPIIAGFIGGFQFPLASKICLKDREVEHPDEVGEVGRWAGFLYGVDLLGSCLGALLASLILIPILGIFQTCLLVSILNFGVLVLLIISASTWFTKVNPSSD
ncbi:fused MFS/spermidine synthase [bacterium]|nr:fused MFS/spermidine synthase [bacterium]